MTRANRNYAVVFACQAIVCMAVNVAIAGAASPQFSVGKTWDWQLSPPYDLSRHVDIIDLDPDEINKSEIATLHKNGVTTICYVSVGTLENWRTDAYQFPDQIVGKTYGDWPDEKFLDIREIEILLPLMQARFARCASAGFDAIEPDNMDVYDNDSGFEISRTQSIAYFKKLAKVAHKLGLKIAQKNVPELSKQLSGTFDFAITESCYQDNACAGYTPYTDKGKAILDAEYNDRRIDFETACAYAANNNISMILKDRDLTQSYQGCQNVH